ncbi:hypothetical protein BSKO_12446 [Bryopsis sp. KO-2023]|nr:hypothetical protein BSKO_12446 [Bryopsis sp. KO-2023]
MGSPARIAIVVFFSGFFVFNLAARELTDHNGSLTGWITFKSETYTLGPNTCKHWEFQSLTKNIVRVVYSPREFPEGCSPEKHLRLIPKIFSTDECVDGKDCQHSLTKLHDGDSLCKNFEDLDPINFDSNADLGAENSLLLTSEPMCTGEKRSLFAIKSTCPEEVDVHITVQAKIVLQSSGACGDHGHEAGNETEILIAVGCLSALTAGICLCLIHLRIKNNKRKARIDLAAQMHTYGSAVPVCGANTVEVPYDRQSRTTALPNILE